MFRYRKDWLCFWTLHLEGYRSRPKALNFSDTNCVHGGTPGRLNVIQCDSMWFNPTSPTLATLLDLFDFVSKFLHPNLLFHLSLRGLYHSWSKSLRTIEMEWEAVLGAEKSSANMCKTFVLAWLDMFFFYGAKGPPIKDILKGWQPALTRYESSQPMLRNESLAGVSQSFSMSVLVQRSNRLWHFSETRWDKIQKPWQNSWPIMTKLCHSHVLCWWLADDIW